MSFDFMYKKTVFFCSLFFFLLLFIFFLKQFIWFEVIDRKKPLIVTTTGMIADLVRVLVCDKADVVALMGPGVDPHMYRARAGDINRLNSASLIVYNGLHLEGKMSDLFSSMRNFKNVISLEELLDKDRLIKVENTDLYDPHIWHDVLLWSSCINPLVKVLQNIIHDDDDSIKQAGETYEALLVALDQSIKDELNQFDKERRILITAHDAFHYFGKAYGVAVYGLQGVSTNAQIGLYDIQRLADFICQKKIPTIFIESCVSDNGITLLKEAVIAAGWNVGIGSELYADALGDVGSGADTYVTMIQSNVNNILLTF